MPPIDKVSNTSLFYRTAVKDIDPSRPSQDEVSDLCKDSSPAVQELAQSPDSILILPLIRFCQSGFVHSFKSRPVEIMSAEVKGSLNISHPISTSKLSETHHHELIS